MAPTLEALIEDVEERRPASALEGITAAEQVAADLARLGDRLIGHYVERARSEGRSWSEIGEHVGITRQAAQQRFGPRSSSLTVADLERAGALVRITDRARRGLARAEDHARRLRHGEVAVEHVVLGILDDPDALAVRALVRSGARLPALRRDLARRHPIGTDEVAVVPVTQEARRCLTSAISEALRLGHNYVGTEHLAIAAADHVDLGVDQADLRAAVVDLLAEYLRTRE